MSWSANGLGENVIKELTEHSIQHYNANSKEVIEAQIKLVKSFLELTPDTHFVIADCTGHIDSYSAYQKVETRIIKK